jgi:hypothetical protein
MRCRPPLDDAEVAQVVASITRLHEAEIARGHEQTGPSANASFKNNYSRVIGHDAGNRRTTRILDGYACRRPRQRANTLASAEGSLHCLKSDAAAGANDEKFRHGAPTF